MDAFLRWSHPDLLEARLFHCCALWHVLVALGLDPAEHVAPDRGPVSALVLPGWPQPLLLSSARCEPDTPTTFRIGDSSTAANLFALFEAADFAPDPLDAGAWVFWLVPGTQLHPDRRSIGLQALLRARGAGQSLQQLPAAVAQHSADLTVRAQ